ncbi:UPF0104 family protein [Streptomyces sp. L7]
MHAPDTTAITPNRPTTAPHRTRRWLRPVVITVLLALFTTELVLGWPSLAAALSQLRAPRLNWFAVALVARGRRQWAVTRACSARPLRSAGVIVPIQKHIALAYAAHSLSVTLPGGPAFSTHFNYQQMRRFGATPPSPPGASRCPASSPGGPGRRHRDLRDRLRRRSLQWHSLVTPAWPSCCSPSASGASPATGEGRTGHPGRARQGQLQVAAPSREPGQLDRIRGFVEQLRAPPGCNPTARRRRRRRLRRAQLAARRGLSAWLSSYHAASDTQISSARLLLAFCAGMAAGASRSSRSGLGIIDSALVLGLVSRVEWRPAPPSRTVVPPPDHQLTRFIIGVGWITWLVIRRHGAAVSRSSGLSRCRRGFLQSSTCTLRIHRIAPGLHRCRSTVPYRNSTEPRTTRRPAPQGPPGRHRGRPSAPARAPVPR